jgi:hypothetical protein
MRLVKTLPSSSLWIHRRKKYLRAVGVPESVYSASAMNHDHPTRRQAGHVRTAAEAGVLYLTVAGQRMTTGQF